MVVVQLVMEFHEGCFCYRPDEAEEARRSGLEVHCAPGLPCSCIVLHDLAIAPELDPLFDPTDLLGNSTITTVTATTNSATNTSTATDSLSKKVGATKSDSGCHSLPYSCPCMALHVMDAKRKKCCGDNCGCDAEIDNCTCSVPVKCCTFDESDFSLRRPPPKPVAHAAATDCCNETPVSTSCSTHPPSLLGSMPNIHTTLLLPGISDPPVVHSHTATTSTTASTMPQPLLRIAADAIPRLTSTPTATATNTHTNLDTANTSADTTRRNLACSTSTCTNAASAAACLPPTITTPTTSLAHSHLSHPHLHSYSQAHSSALEAAYTPINLANIVVPPKLDSANSTQATVKNTNAAPPLPPSGRRTRKRNLVAQFYCNDCDATFSTRDASESHSARVHGRTRPYACDKCGAKFLFKQNRDRHVVEVHHGARPHKCPKEDCTATFKNSSALKQHLRTVHEKQRPFKCQLCPSAFGQRNHLSQHVLVVHERRKLFHCDICGTSFSNRGNLNQHVRRKHKPKPPKESKSSTPNNSAPQPLPASTSAPSTPAVPFSSSLPVVASTGAAIVSAGITVASATTAAAAGVPAVVSTGGSIISTVPAVHSPPPELVTTSNLSEE